MRTLRSVIVDDEALSRRAMRQLLEMRRDVEVVAEYEDATSAVASLGNGDVDVVFLDVLMPRRSGLDLARALPQNGPPFVVFVTAYDEYAIPAFETDALDYLSKPVTPERLGKTIARLRDRLRSLAETPPSGMRHHEPAEQLLTRVGDRDVVIPVAEIDSIGADGVYAAVSVGERRYLVRSSLDALERTLSSGAFLRVHRSWIIPRDRIISIRRSASGPHREIVLRSGFVVPISRRRQSEVMRFLRGSLRH